jgi:N-acetylglucosaminyl-diphospho-decaprenol L-rhamnosyltransferase
VVLSILIVNWNTREMLIACLRSIFAHPPRCGFEVIVVDNASTDGSGVAVAHEFPQVRLLSQTKNLGYAEGNNVAFSLAQGEWLLTLNPDTEVFDGTLDNAVEVMEKHPSFGALGVRQIGPDGETQRSVRGFPSWLGIFGDLTGLGKLFPRSRFGSYRLRAFDYGVEQPAPQPMGTFLLFRRVALPDPTCPFDPQFPIFFNEVDLLYRMALRGWPALYSPDVRIKHHGGESTKQVRPAMIWESHRSLLRYFRKHHAKWWNLPAMALLSALVTVSAFVRARGYHAGFRA